MFMDNHDEKVIEYLAQHKNILWTGIIVLIGGLVGLGLTYNPILLPYSFSNIVRLILIFVGVPLLISMIIGVLNTDSEIKDILRKG